jgi:hypothetical protein
MDAFGQAYLGYLLDTHIETLPHIGMALAGLTLLLGLAYVASAAPASQKDLARYGRALAIVLPIFVLLISQAKAWTYQQLYSDSVRADEPTPLNWVSRATPEQVAMLLPSDAFATTFYQSEFWNPNVNRAWVSPVSPVDSHVVFSPTCLFRTKPSGEILPSSGPGCDPVSSAWLVESGTFSMHLRDETKRVHPNTGIRSTLMIARAPAMVLSMVGGRNVRDGIVDRALTVRTYSERAGRVRIVAQASGGPIGLNREDGQSQSIRAGKTVTIEYPTVPGLRQQTYSVQKKAGSASRLRVSRIEFREGNGPWRDIR